MTKLLISVRSVAEAQLALDEGADLIDVKEPLRGSLGAADVETIRAVVDAVAAQVPVSAALGELSCRARLPASLANRLHYAKFGLAGCAAQADWKSRWREAIGELPDGIVPVAVAYADWKTAGAPDPMTVLRDGALLGCKALLIDTHDKSQGSLVEHFAWTDLQRFIAATREQGLLSVVGGGLRPAEISELLPLAPDFVAVRGAACMGQRTGHLDPARVRGLVSQLREANRHSAAKIAG